MALAAFHAAEIAPALARIALLIWPFWLLLAGFGLFRLAVRRSESRRLAASGILELDRMTDREFDDRVRDLLRHLGYTVGPGLVIEKGGRRAVVHAAISGEPVDRGVVRAADAARRLHALDEAWVVTNRDFTRNARRLASRTGVDLWNRERLVASLLRANA